MADILDDLEGFLGAEAATKIRGNAAMSDRLKRYQSVTDFYDGNMEGEPPAPRQRTQDPPPARTATGTESLADIMGELRTVTEKIGKIDDVVATKVDEVVGKRGNELVNNAVAIAMRNNRELTKVDARHRADFGEDLDDAKLEAHVQAAAKAGRPFRTVTEAYEDMTREARMEKEVDKRASEKTREALKVRADSTMPGVSGTSGGPMLRILKKTPNGSASGGGDHISKAAQALNDRLAERGEVVA